MNGIGGMNLAVAVFLLFTITACPAQRSRLARRCPTALGRSVNDFGASLAKQLEAEGNFFISPLSIFNALAMVYIGAEGQTAEQISNALRLEENRLNKSLLNQAFREFLDIIATNNDEYELHLANGIFLQQEYPVDQTYVNDIQTVYDGILKVVDFVDKGTETKDMINSFVSENTNGKIDNFLKEPLDPTTVFALVNAIYFKGFWKTQFQRYNTRNGVFHKNDGSTKTVKFMLLEKQQLRFLDDEISNYKFLDLPYRGNDISMLLALPNDYKEAPELEMNSNLMCRMNSDFRLGKVDYIVIPKFQIKYRKGLVDVLKELGILNVFDSADLTGIRPQGDIAVSDVLHEAVIEVNEEGSKATALSAVFLNRSFSKLNIFMANHPFLFYIVDNRNGLILFSGRVSDP